MLQQNIIGWKKNNKDGFISSPIYDIGNAFFALPNCCFPLKFNRKLVVISERQKWRFYHLWVSGKLFWRSHLWLYLLAHYQLGFKVWIASIFQCFVSYEILWIVLYRCTNPTVNIYLFYALATSIPKLLTSHFISKLLKFYKF